MLVLQGHRESSPVGRPAVPPRHVPGDQGREEGAELLMITISTTTEDEVRAMFAIMERCVGREYEIYLLGRRVRFLPPPDGEK